MFLQPLSFVPLDSPRTFFAPAPALLPETGEEGKIFLLREENFKQFHPRVSPTITSLSRESFLKWRINGRLNLQPFRKLIFYSVSFTDEFCRSPSQGKVRLHNFAVPRAHKRGERESLCLFKSLGATFKCTDNVKTVTKDSLGRAEIIKFTNRRSCKIPALINVLQQMLLGNLLLQTLFAP